MLSCGVGNHLGLRGLPGGAEGIRTDGHRGRGEISSWIAAWGIRSPTQGRLGGGPAFRRATPRYRGRGKDLRRHLSLRSRRRKEAKANAENTGIERRRHPEELPIDPLQNTSLDSGLRPECANSGRSQSARRAGNSTRSGHETDPWTCAFDKPIIDPCRSDTTDGCWGLAAWPRSRSI